VSVENLPLLNACLNSLSFLFLSLGWRAIKNDQKTRHKKFMLSAVTTSSLFLSSYLYYHFTVVAVTKYPGTGFWKWVYFFILSTHIPLAIITLPVIFYILYQAFSENFEKHKKVARWLLPTWMYVSITGVIIYLMLYVF